MKTELFGIKITKTEKAAIHYISKRSKKPASKVFYQDFDHALKTKLGLTLLFDISRSGEFDEAFTNIVSTGKIALRRAPRIIEAFLKIIERQEVKRQFRRIFDGVKFEDKGFLLYEIDMNELASTIGSEYLAQHGSFNPVRLDLVHDIFFEYILSIYYQFTAVGSLKELSNQWSGNLTKIHAFKSEIQDIYQEEYEEPVEVTEEILVVEALAPSSNARSSEMITARSKAKAQASKSPYPPTGGSPPKSEELAKEKATRQIERKKRAKKKGTSKGTSKASSKGTSKSGAKKSSKGSSLSSSTSDSKGSPKGTKESSEQSTA